MRWSATRAHSRRLRVDDDLVDDVAAHELLEHPREVRAVDAEHRRARADRAGRATKTVLSGCSCARRCTMWISVPIAEHRAGAAPARPSPGCARSSRPGRRARRRRARTRGARSPRPSGCSARAAATCSGRKRWCTEQWPFQSSSVASLTSRSSRPPQLEARVPHPHVGLAVAHVEAGVAAEVLVGEEEHLVALGRAPTRARPARSTTCTPRRRARPTNAFSAADEFM